MWPSKKQLTLFVPQAYHLQTEGESRTSLIKAPLRTQNLLLGSLTHGHSRDCAGIVIASLQWLVQPPLLPLHTAVP